MPEQPWTVLGMSKSQWDMLEPSVQDQLLTSIGQGYTPPPPPPVNPNQNLLDAGWSQAEIDIHNQGLTGEILDIMAGFGNQWGLTIGPSAAYDWYQLNQLTDQAGDQGFFTSSDFQFSPTAPFSTTFSPIDLNIVDAPPWWQALSPDVVNPVSEYQTLTNLMIPFLSPEDQYTAATNLFQSNPEQFSIYNPELIERSPAPAKITPSIRRKYFTGERAQKTLDAFDQLLSLTGKTTEDYGSGYNYLRTLADTIRDFGLTSGANQLTEVQQGELLSALDPLLAQTKSQELSAYGPVAQSYVNPFFSAGSLTGTVRNQFGDIVSPRNPAYQ